MAYTEPARTSTGRMPIRWIRVAAVAVVIAAIAAALGTRQPAPSSRTTAGEIDGAVVRSEHGGALGEADGAVPDGTTVFDNAIPGVARLDAALLSALRKAATDAAGSGVELRVDSGWRSPEYQEQLLRDAIAKYGSLTQALRWVAAPNRSAHVKGGAVDIGPSGAAAWLTEHGATYGLCRIYANEPWHFELRPEAGQHGCPSLYADPTHDPRMHATAGR